MARGSRRRRCGLSQHEVNMIQFSEFHTLAGKAKDSSTLYLDGSGSDINLTLKAPNKTEINHTRTWNHFLEAANDLYGEKSVKRIFERYAVDPKHLSEQNSPLLAKHVHMLELGATLLRKKDLKHLLGSDTSISSLERFLAERSPQKPSNVDTSRLMGGPTTWSGFFFHDRYLMDKELHLLFSDVADLSWEAYIERLCKSVLPRELPLGLIVRAPNPQARGSSDFYEIYDIITVGDGLVAYAFKPLDKDSALEPMIGFRGSPFHFSAVDILETWMNNLQKYIGWLGFQTARGKLAKLAHDFNFCPEKKGMTVAGFSLGGNHAQLFTTDHYDRISSAIFFNDPSIDAETADLFATKINATRKLRHAIKAKIFRTEGDVANYAGQKHAFCGVEHPQVDVELTVIKPDKELTASQCHGWKHFDTKGEVNHTKRVYTDPDDLERELDNAKRGPEVEWYENVRLVGSYFIYPFFYVWNRTFHFLEDITGIPVVRHSLPK